MLLEPGKRLGSSGFGKSFKSIAKKEFHYDEYLNDYKSMMNAIVPLQRNDGSWNVSLYDSTHYGGKELTGTALFTYGMAWGINNGFLDKKKFLPVVIKAWNALSKLCSFKWIFRLCAGNGQRAKRQPACRIRSCSGF